REHDDGGRGLLAAQAPADGEAVLAGQHQVEHDEVIALAAELLVHAARIRHGLHLEAFAAQILHEQVAQALVVVYYEDAGLELGHVSSNATTQEITREAIDCYKIWMT